MSDFVDNYRCFAKQYQLALQRKLLPSLRKE